MDLDFLGIFTELDWQHWVAIACIIAVVVVFLWNYGYLKAEAQSHCFDYYGNVSVTPANTQANGVLTFMNSSAYEIYYNPNSLSYKTACKVKVVSK